MDIKDQVILNNIFQLLEVPALHMSTADEKLRWSQPATIAIVLAKWITKGGIQKQSLWVDAPTEREAQLLANDLSIILPDVRVDYFPGFSQFVGGESSPPELVLKNRLTTLIGLLERKVQILVTGPLTAKEKLPHPTWFKKQKLELHKNTDVPRELLLETLVTLGYRHSDITRNQGDFSTRGMVIDLWPDHLDNPTRLEFFNNELEKISYFDSGTQRRTGDYVETLTIYPRFEGDRGDGIPLIDALKASAIYTKDPDEDIAFRQSRLATRGFFPGEELFYPLLSQPKGQLAHWMPPCLRVKLDPKWAETVQQREVLRIQKDLAILRGGGVVCPQFEDRFLTNDPSRTTIILTEWQSEATIALHSQPTRDFQGNLGELAEYLKELSLTGNHIFLAGSTKGMRDRLGAILQEYELPVSYGLESGCRSIHLPLSSGFYLKESMITILTEQEVFGRKTMATIPKRSHNNAFLSDLRELKPGDRVVHLDHGIGEFLGFACLLIGGEEQEVIQLRYSDGGMLNVNLERADLIQSYNSQDGKLAPLDKLGNSSWIKIKRRVKKAIRDMAEELLKLYAKRKLEKGHAYSKDGPEMIEFEATFPFEPTVDQIEATEAIKADLESDRPMDRLLCGDVGFGKTEVAMRAAAKVAIDGFQVAVLCPTTVLCFQHFRTFKERFRGFPIKINMLNRFVDKQTAKLSLQNIADGHTQIIIGTHQILSDKVKFAELGLLIIDEEQRFGVIHKERFKKLRGNIDVLSMSATPIPRTLHMSLTGLREISMIETPPKDRLAIETVVAPWSDELITTAIQFELRRGGQVYVVHNRVDSITSMAERIRALVPDARVGVGHAKLSANGLEMVMMAFVERKIDVLVTTTIIENGLDVPNANTLIVHRADAFGLSQLYQLRGRVGRSDVPAYAYLLVPDKSEITEDARKRLQALEDFSELGAGFRVAAIDLELRGAGNLLGGEQSGQIHDIGFELYVKLLDEALHELQGQPSGNFEVKINLGHVQLSRKWIDRASERLVAYKRASRLHSDQDLDLYRMELEDRFGKVPIDDDESLCFFDVLKIRIKAQALAVSDISVENGRLKLHISPQTPLEPIKIMTWVQQQKNAKFNADNTITLPACSNKDDLILQVSNILSIWTKL
jgi:transcription-repair coupling factor (superfamily II helicase)